MPSRCFPERRSISALISAGPARLLATLAIVSGTFVSVLGTTILNVPISDIASDLHVSIADITLLITAQAIAFASCLPLGGWVGNRFGRKNVYCIAVATMGIAGLIAMFGQNLPTLVAMRIIQGLSSASIVSLVMTLLSDLYEPERRPLALSMWAVANSLGQAMGPPLGGLLAVTFGWRAIFAPAPLIAAFAFAAAIRYLPSEPARESKLEWRGALSLTGGALMLLVGVSAIPHYGLASPFVLGFALAGIVSLGIFAHSIVTTDHPFVSPQAFREPTYVASCIGVLSATVCLGAALLAIPLYLERSLGFSTDKTGYITLALPLAMALVAPLTSFVVKRFGPVRAVQGGLLVLGVASAAIAFITANRLGFIPLIPFLLALGAAVAAHYTGGAVGTTQTAAGRYGAGIGLFNLMRIAGTAIGPALVGTILERDSGAYAAIFIDTGAVAAAALVWTLLLRPTVSSPAATGPSTGR